MAKELPIRKIIHVDMDAFYASVEQLDNPELRGLPVAVGGGGNRGVVSAASYEARRFGVRSAMTGVMARRNCPEVIFVPPRFKRYKEISRKVHSIFHDYTELIEPLSLDEAYLDVTENKIGFHSATLIARQIRQRIFEEVGLTASAGISINKFIAKIASDINKPNGQKTVPPEEVLSFLEELDIRKFYGVGKITARQMYALGIFTGMDLKSKSVAFLESQFGKSGRYYYDAVRGIHNSPVQPDRIRKSLAAERTFETNLSSEVFMMDKLDQIADEVVKRLKNNNVKGKTITLKIKYSDFSLQTRSKTTDGYTDSKTTIIREIRELLQKEKPKDSVRLLGISISNLDNSSEENKEDEKTDISVQLKFDF